jgi:peptidoglycan/LPS O-acetylase OafA/YrhL
MIIGRIGSFLYRGGVLAEAERQSNNLNLMRLLAAVAVLFAHCWPLALDASAQDPLSRALSSYTGRKLVISGLAVNMFFIISGYLVTKSAVMRSNLVEFTWARILRIYPALIVNVLAVSLVIGPIITSATLVEYFSDSLLWKFVSKNLVMWDAAYYLPGVFEQTMSKAVNGSLWTLPLEIRCYIGVGLLYLTRALNYRILVTLIFAGLYALHVAMPEAEILGASAATPNYVYFILGGNFFLYRKWIPAHPIFPTVLLIGGLLMSGVWYGDVAAMLGCVWLVLWAGLVAHPLPSFRRWLGDPSYGVYIWAFPIQQLTIVLWSGLSPWGVLVITLPTTLLISVLSWRYVEKPALAQKAMLGQFSAGHLRLVKAYMKKVVKA